MRVLVIDDLIEEYILSYTAIKEYFPQAEIDHEMSAEFAMHKVQHDSPYDLILTDLSMPKMNGYKFIEWARENDVKAQIAILTGSAAYYNTKRASDLNVPILKKTLGHEDLCKFLIKIKKENK